MYSLIAEGLGASCATAEVVKCLSRCSSLPSMRIISRVLTVLDSQGRVVGGGRSRRTRTGVDRVCEFKLSVGWWVEKDCYSLTDLALTIGLYTDGQVVPSCDPVR